jgi:CheY-like chemotaxis protein
VRQIPTHIPVVMLSGEREPATIQRRYQLHANAYIIKPTQPDQLQNVLQRMEEVWFSIVTLSAGEEVSLKSATGSR